MFWRSTASRSNKFTASLLSCNFCRLRGPLSQGGLLVRTPGWAARRSPGSAWSGRAEAPGDGVSPCRCRPAVVWEPPLNGRGAGGRYAAASVARSGARRRSCYLPRPARRTRAAGPSRSTAADLNQRGLSQRPWANGTPRRWSGGVGPLAMWSDTALFSRPLLPRGPLRSLRRAGPPVGEASPSWPRLCNVLRRKNSRRRGKSPKNYCGPLGATR